AWQVRDRYGVQCSALRTNVNTSKPLDESQKQTLAGWNGIVTAGWTGMEELLAAPDVAADLASKAKEARAQTDSVSKQRGQVTKDLDGSGRPAIPASEWDTLCQSPFPQIVGVATTALDQSIARAAAMQEKALTNLIVQSLAFLVALLVTLAGVYV